MKVCGVIGILFLAFCKLIGAQNALPQDAGSLNSQILEIAEAIRQAPAGPATDALRNQAATLAIKRAEVLTSLVREKPEAAASLALPQDVVSDLVALIPEAQRNMETRGHWTGTVSYWIEERSDREPSLSQVHLKTATEELDLHFTGSVPGIRSGDVLEASGLLVGTSVLTDSASVRITAASTGSTQTACSTTGTQNTAVVLVTFPGVSLPVTQQSLNDMFFGSTGASVDGFMRAASYGQTSVQGAVFGPFTLTGTYSNVSCSGLTAVFNDGIAAAIAGGANLNNYSRIFLAFPDTLGCEWAGFASVGGCSSITNSGTFNATTSYVSVGYMTTLSGGVALAAHEMGHNFGLLHSGIITAGANVLGPVSSPGTEYDQNGDYWSALGETVMGLYPAPQKAEVLGWMTSPANYLTVQSSGTWTLQPLETSPAGLQALKVQRGSGNSEWLWLEYRQPVGNYDSTLLPQPFSGALIHYEDANTALGHTYMPNFTGDTSWNSPALAAGQTWTDLYTNLSISVVSATSTGLTVAVTYGAMPCTHANPTVSLSPANPSVYAGSQVTYMVTVTNNDSMGCAASTFAVNATQPAGWSESLSSTAVVLTPGQSGSLTLTETIPVPTPAGSYVVGAGAGDTNGSGSASVNCTVTAPSLSDNLLVSGSVFSGRQSVAISSQVNYGTSPAGGARLTFKLTEPNGNTVTNSATANSGGQATWTWKIGTKYITGTYTVTSTVQYGSLSAASNSVSFVVQ